MADKEEVEPTEESAAAEPSDVADDLQPVDADPNEPVDGAEAESETPSAGAHALNDDDFDKIVRDSGLDDRLPESDAASPDSPSEDEKALEPVGAGALISGNSGAAARERAARKSKEAATRRRDQPVKVERTGPVKFVRESIGELRKVVYPTGQQLINYFIVVLVFVLFIIAYVSLLDLGLGALIFKIFS